MKKVSIIIAAYNMEDYIEETLQSAVAQTLDDIEIIVANDCSTDETAEKVTLFAKKDPRIHLVNLKENKGPMLARKEACTVSDGKYTMFLDGDDLLIPEACEIAYNAIERERVDILQFETEVFGDDKILHSQAGAVAGVYAYMQGLNKKIVSSDKAGLMGRRECRDHLNFTMWNKIYNSKLIEQVNKELPDEHLAMAEDMLFSFIAGVFAKSYADIKEKIHRYRFGNGISTAQNLSKARMQSVAKTYYVYNFLKEWTEEKGCEKICRSRLDTMRMQFLSNMSGAFLTQIHAEDRQIYMDYVLQYCPLNTFLSALCFGAYCNHLAPSEVLSESLAGLSQLKATKKEIKTVATFYYRARNGGIENVLSQITEAWIQAGYKVVLFTDEPAHEDDYPLNENIIRVVLPVYEHGKFYTYEERMDALRDACKTYDVDIMIYHAWLHMQIVADIIAVKQLGIPFAVHTHSVFCVNFSAQDVGYTYKNLVLHKVYSLCDTVITLNRADQAYWSAFGLNCVQTVNPIPYKTDTPIAPLNGHNLLMTCRISPEKQILDAIKITEAVRKKIPDVTLTIVGAPDTKTYMDEITGYIKTKKLQDTVILPGFQKDVLPYYQNADIMLITSEYEGFPLSLVESKMCGVPLVIYELPHLDTVQAAKGMAVVPQKDILGAARHIIDILSDDVLKKEMGRAARQSAEEIYSHDLKELWKNIFDKTLNPVEKESLSPASAAILTMNSYMLQGIVARASYAPQTQEIASDTDSKLTLDAYTNHVLTLEATVREIRSSTSYRLGWFLTWPFRKIKDKIKGQKYVE
ncbi:MAG: glycosyltransferase [Clostridia bacterium]|nr:glycosyltransferase [Clostridia bacterium]